MKKGFCTMTLTISIQSVSLLTLHEDVLNEHAYGLGVVEILRPCTYEA